MSSSPMSVQVTPQYLAERSAPEQNRYAFAYTITVTNVAEFALQLVARHWQIQDSSGYAQEVKGLGVVGEQPLLAPGESFRYTSGCTLHAATGTMRGSYLVLSETAEQFEIPIPVFVLDAQDHSSNAPASSDARVLH